VPQEGCPPRGCIEPFSIYPNPIDGELNINILLNDVELSTESNGKEKYQVTIYDRNGSLLYYQNHSSTELKINFDSYKSGEYHLKINYKGQEYQQRLIKN